MRQTGVCPKCGETVSLIVADDHTRVCPVCGQLTDIDEITEVEE